MEAMYINNKPVEKCSVQELIQVIMRAEIQINELKKENENLWEVVKQRAVIKCE
jgi:hypothetical protein